MEACVVCTYLSGVFFAFNLFAQGKPARLTAHSGVMSSLALALWSRPYINLDAEAHLQP